MKKKWMIDWILQNHKIQHDVKDNQESDRIEITLRFGSGFDDFDLIRKLDALELPMSIENRGGVITLEIEYK